jgi:ADP-heptose:LPS heptosyltransferase
MIDESDIVLSIDSFVPHLARYYKCKAKVVVLWGKSDPLIFGYSEHINLLKDRKYLKTQQFQWWKDEPYNPEVFVSPEEVFNVIQKMV